MKKKRTTTISIVVQGGYIMKLKEYLNNLSDAQVNNLDMGNVSDGYHTFNELYDHRMVLFSIICRTYNSNAWRSKLHDDGNMFDGYFIVGVNTPEGQFTYHYKEECWKFFDGIEELPRAPKWDGHQPSDITRLLSLVQDK